MPTSNEHLTQYKSNKSLLSEPFFDLQSTSYYDWFITICYYASLHIVDSELHKNHYQDEDIDNHLKRRKKIRELVRHQRYFIPVAEEYLWLENESRRARYDCEIITRDDANECLGRLCNIESSLVISLF